MLEEIIKRKEKISILGYNPGVPTQLNKFTTSTGTLDSRVLGGSQKNKNRILVL